MALKTLRIRHNWSQEDLAEMSGLSVRTIQRIERNHKAGLESLKSLAAAFNISVEDIRNELDIADETELSDESYANNIIGFYALSTFLALMHICIFLPHALQDSSNWGSFIAICLFFVMIVAGYSVLTFGSSWKHSILSRRKQKR